MANQAKTKVVIIHGSHHELVDGKRVHHKMGAELELHTDELMRLDPQFRNGLGERFASPEKAAKLKQKAALDAELDRAEADEPDEGDDEAADPVTEEPDEAPPAPPAGVVPPKLKKTGKAKA